MNKVEFLNGLEEIMELDENSLTGSETLKELEVWDSLAVLGFIAMIDNNFGVTLDVKKITDCVTVEDLMSLVSEYLKN